MKKLRVAICAPNRTSSSETFIANHVAGLEGEIYFLYGGWLPNQYNGKSLSALYKEGKTNSGRRLLNKFTGRKPFVPSDAELFSQFLLRHSIDVVLAEYGPTGVNVGGLCRKLNIPFVVHFHGFDAYHKDTLQTYREKYMEVFSHASAVVAVSDHMEAQLRSLGIPSRLIHKIHYGVDVEKFPSENRSWHGNRFLTVGRFVTKKAPHLNILAFHKVIQAGFKANMIMAGDPGLGNSPELMIACKQLVKSLGLEESVTFPGGVSHEHISELMREADVFLQHSVTSENGDGEGTPNTILEASARGLCIIATRHAGIPDVVEDKVTGWLVEEFQINEMAERMIFCIQHPDVTLEMGKKGSQRIRSNFRLKDQLGKLKLILKNAVE